MDRGQYHTRQLAAPKLIFWPTPDKTTGVVVGTDANNYLCIKSHTSTTDDKPITGADYATYWEQVTDTGAVWAADTAYNSDIVRFDEIIRLQDFDATANNPDFPVQFYDALVYNLAVQISPNFGFRGPNLEQLRAEALSKFEDAKGGDREKADIQVTVRNR